MPHPTPLRSGDPKRVGQYRLTGRLEGIPSDDPIFTGVGPDDMHVSITVLSGDWALDAAARDRFAAEAAVARRVPPFCAARVLDAGLDGSQAYLVSEYVYGESLLEMVSADGVQREHDLEAVAIGMATGLASVHQAGLVHGNFGPEFVIMATDGAPRVVEFGITPPYGAATPSADMLAWAQTVVFAALGRPPAEIDDLDALPERLRDPVARCLDPEPAQRPAARAVVQSLLGTEDLPAGVLAEGSRRAIRAARISHSQGRLGPAGYAGASNAGVGVRPSARQPAAARSEADNADEHLPARQAATRTRVRRSEPGLSKRRGGWLIGAVLVAVIIVGAVATHALLASHANARLSANAGAKSKTSSPAPSASPSQDPVTPAAFAGSWSGIVTQPPTDAYYVSVTFAAGKSAGTVSYAATSFSCSGALTLAQATPQKLLLTQGIIQGQSKCENGLVTITLTSADKIRFSFRNPGPATGPVAAGTLTRQ
jgi:hypothetical protein